MREMQHQYFSFRKGLNKNPKGLPFGDIRDLVGRILARLKSDGYFDEDFGFICVDEGLLPGKIRDPDLEILLQIRKKNLWPVEKYIDGYSEDDLFDMLEFLYLHVSKPVDGRRHDYENCGMHWETFNKAEGQKRLASDVNRILEQYEKRFELAENGWILEESRGRLRADLQGRYSNLGP